MQLFAVLCLAAVALARPQEFSQRSNGVVTTVTERTFTIRGEGEADKYYGSSGSSYNAGVSGYSSGASGYAAKQYSQPSYSFQTVASAVPVAQRQSYQSYGYQHAATPVQNYQHTQQYAAPAQSYQYSAPAVAYQAVPLVQAAAPAVAYTAVTAAPAVAYQAVTAAPAVAYQGSNYNANYQSSVASGVGVRAQGSFEGQNYQDNYQTSYENTQVSGADTKIYKHVYAFAGPEEPSTRATIRVQAPASKRKHYKLVFIKAPSQQTIVDSDITLPAQEEEKTLIYVLSKNQKQAHPEIRIKQAAASKHAKPEVFFLKYKNEAEAQAIANGAIAGQNSGVPAEGEIISDGSVSILGQGSSSFASDSSLTSGSSFGSGFESGSSFDNSFRAGGSVNSGSSNVIYRSGSTNAGLSAVSAGTVGIVPAAVVATNVAPVSTYSQVASAPVAAGSSSSYGSSGVAGLSGGFSAYSSRSGSYSQEPASVSVKVTNESTESLESATPASF